MRSGLSSRGVFRPGAVRWVQARQGNSCRQQQGALRCSLLLSTESGHGAVECGMARRDLAAHGKVTVADSSTELRKRLPAALFERVDEAGHGVPRSGAARRGYSCRRQHRRLRLPLLLSLESGCGVARFGTFRRGRIRNGQAMQGRAWFGPAIAADGSTEGASLPCCSLWRVDKAR